MGLWDSIKHGTSNMMELSDLESKIKKNQELTDDENKRFEELSKSTVVEQLANKPSKFFNLTDTYGLLSIDEDKKLFKINNNVYRFENLNSYELLENNSSISSGGLGVGRAIVGGVLLGGVGAVLGGVTKKRKNTNVVESLKIFVTLKDSDKKSENIDFITKKQKRDKKFETILENAKMTMSGFDYIVSLIEDDKTENTTIISETSLADELLKLKSLVDQGILTQEEFDEQKEKLLNK